MAYDTQDTYNKFNAKKCGHDDPCGCESDQCGCCPIGLVEVKDKDGSFVGCLSPADAQEYMSKSFRCNDGYIKVTDATSGEFIGCLTPDEYAAYKAIAP